MNRAQRRATKKPDRLVIGGEEYSTVVVKIMQRDHLGRPRMGMFVYPEQTVDVADGDAFLIVFAHGPSIAPRGN